MRTLTPRQAAVNPAVPQSVTLHGMRVLKHTLTFGSMTTPLTPHQRALAACEFTLRRERRYKRRKRTLRAVRTIVGDITWTLGALAVGTLITSALGTAFGHIELWRGFVIVWGSVVVWGLAVWLIVLDVRSK